MKHLFHFCKFDKVQEDNYQYCKICGKAKAAPKPCAYGHIYKNFLEAKTLNHLGKLHYIITQQCKNCGDLRNFNQTTGQFETRHH